MCVDTDPPPWLSGQCKMSQQQLYCRERALSLITITSLARPRHSSTSSCTQRASTLKIPFIIAWPTISTMGIPLGNFGEDMYFFLWLSNDLNDNTSAFINCEDSITMDSSQHLQGGTVPPLNHCYIEPTRHRHGSPCKMKPYWESHMLGLIYPGINV